MRDIPPFLVLRFIKLVLQKRIHFPECQNKEKVQGDEDFVAFRKVVLDPSINNTVKPEAILRIYFKFAKFSFTANRYLSLIPIPLIVSQPGFRSKTWLFSKETEVFQGLYEWTSIQNAETYMNSLVVKLMKKRSLPGTLRCEITKRNV